MAHPLRLSDLSPARQALVRLCQAINYGSIENLEVRQSDPIFHPPPVVLKEVKLDRDEEPRPELGLKDFVLSDEILRLVALLRDMKSGTLRHIEVRAGIPRRMQMESRRFDGPDISSGLRESI